MKGNVLAAVLLILDVLDAANNGAASFTTGTLRRSSGQRSHEGAQP